jgi:hypothetical protein
VVAERAEDDVPGLVHREVDVVEQVPVVRLQAQVRVRDEQDQRDEARGAMH